MSTAIDNSGLINICHHCADGLVASLNYSYNPGTKALTVTDASVFGAGDAFGVANVTVTDRFGNVKEAQITAAAGNVVIDLATNFNVNEGFNITVTVVSEKRSTANIAVYNVASAIQNAGIIGVEIPEEEDDEESGGE